VTLWNEKTFIDWSTSHSKVESPPVGLIANF
jgi:hypothetical protein